MGILKEDTIGVQTIAQLWHTLMAHNLRTWLKIYTAEPSGIA